MVGECFGRCSPASLSLWLPQTKGPALSAATEQAMKGSLSERHKERKEETWVSGTGFAWLLTFHANFHERWWWSLCAGEHVCVPASLCFTDTFQSKMKTCRWNKNGWELKQTNKQKNPNAVLWACWLMTEQIQMRQFGLRGRWMRNVD